MYSMCNIQISKEWKQTNSSYNRKSATWVYACGCPSWGLFDSIPSKLTVWTTSKCPYIWRKTRVFMGVFTFYNWFVNYNICEITIVCITSTPIMHRLYCMHIYNSCFLFANGLLNGSKYLRDESQEEGMFIYQGHLSILISWKCSDEQTL